MTNPLYDTLFGRHAGSEAPFLYPEGGAPISHAGFLAMAARLSNAITSLGLVPGDRVAAQIDKSPDALALYAACVQGGFVFLPLNTAYTAAELGYFLSDSGAKLVVASDAAEARVAPLVAGTGAVVKTLNADGTGSLAALAAGQAETAPVAERGGNDLAALLYTSGTTGRSKGAMLSQNNLLSNALTLAEAWRFTEKDVLLHALPIFHTHGLFVATNVMLATGGAMIFFGKFDVDALIREMPRATALMGVPTFYTRLLDHPAFTRDLTKGMRLFVSGSAPLLAETHIRFEERTGHRILERYGMTETNMNTSNPYQGDRRAGTVGLPLPGVELKITDPATGATLPQGEVGVIEVRGANVFQGYWQMPEKTREELREDGFFITGDLARMDADGYVTIIGRGKDLIISGGFNVYPKEVETLLDEQPGVLESAVIGVPHPDLGEVAVGILVRQKGQEPDLQQIAAAMGQALARFRQPRKLIVVDELPRNTMGKVQKNILRQSYGGLFA
ncbi:MAG: malonate--CoA ligase [Marivivens sp.]